MKITTRPSALAPVASIAALVMLGAASHAEAGTPISKLAAVAPGGSVEISNTAGQVTVTGWDRNEVEVTGTLGDGSERLEFTTQDKVTRIRVVLPNKSWHVEDTALVVKVPAGSSLSVSTTSADIRVRGVRGAQRLQSVSGDVNAEAGTEDVECQTISGDVAMAGSGLKGLLNITTVSGDVMITHVAGELNGNTVSGNFTITLGDTVRARLRTTSGDVSMATQLAADGRLDVESISGDVGLDLAGPVNAAFDVSSFSGEIRNCFGPKPRRTDEYAPGKEWHFAEGQGAARVRIKTMNGDISVCRK
jgi:DUF4097 and DUF4098 domain-containing protein YvlB